MNTKAIPQKAVPQIIPHTGTLAVCAWCYPGKSVFNDYPWLRTTDGVTARTISHGICLECKGRAK